jgi:hypothetical protein
VRNGAEFLLAIKESTHTTFDDDAHQFLDAVVTAISGMADAQNLRGRERDAVIFFEGMLRGTQLKLLGKKQRAASELQQAGKLNPDLTLKEGH